MGRVLKIGIKRECGDRKKIVKGIFDLVSTQLKILKEITTKAKYCHEEP